MANTAFSVTSPNLLTAAPSGSGEKLIIRSTAAADTANASTGGLVSAVATLGVTALLGKREVETSDTYTTLGFLKLASAQTGVVSVYGQGTKATGDLRVDTLPANNDTLRIGLTGFQQTYTFKSSLTGSANEIKIAASLAAQATNIFEAINAGSGAGTDYGTGTTANAFVVASTPVASVIPLTDKKAVSRLLAWAIDQSVGTTIAIRTMVGGVTGTLLASAPIGVTAVFNSMVFSSEDLVAGTLENFTLPTTNAIATGGRSVTLRFKSDTSTGITVTYETSTDGTNWATGLDSIAVLDGSQDVDAPLFVHLSEANVEYVRLVFQDNTGDSRDMIALDARAIY